MNLRTIVIFFMAILVISVTSCRKKNQFFSDSSASLQFNSDTIFFDTVFTTIGSTTRRFKIYNPYNKSIKVSNIILSGGTSSPFRINIDGVSGVSIKDIEILPKDSLFGFVEVTLDPNNTNNPLVIQDSILFETNNNFQQLQLVAWGQDAYYHKNEVVAGTWLNDKPHVVFGIAAVGYPSLDSNLTLNISDGTQIYMHNKSRILVYKSTLNINGTVGSPVEIKQFRQEAYYEDIPGQFQGLHFIQSNNSTVNYLNMTNAYVGIQIDTVFNIGIPAVTITNSIINNSFSANIFVNAGAIVVAENCLFTNPEEYNGVFANGGMFSFTHCTFASYKAHTEATLLVNNYFENNNTYYVRPIFNSRFNNCIFYGINDDEVQLDFQEGLTPDLIFDHCLYKNQEEVDQNYFTNPIINQSPMFINTGALDFHLFNASPAIEAGNPAYSTSLDLDGNTRDALIPDLGCYEHQ